MLTDLGVARVLGEAAAAEVTPAYVDPTVARGGAPGPGVRRLRRRGGRVPRAHRHRAVERRHPGRHARRRGRPATCPTSRELAPERPGRADRRRRARAVGRSARPWVRGGVRAGPAARLPPGAGAAAGRRASPTTSSAAPGEVRGPSSPTRCPAVGRARHRRWSRSGRRDGWRTLRERLTRRRGPPEAAVLAVVATVLAGAALAALVWSPAAGEPTRSDRRGGDGGCRRPSRSGRADRELRAVGATAAGRRTGARWWRTSTTGGRRRSRPGRSRRSTTSTRRTAPLLRRRPDATCRNWPRPGRRCAASRPRCVRVAAAAVGDDRVELDLVDRWPDYEVVAARRTAVVRTEPGPGRVRRPHGAGARRRTAGGSRAPPATG